MKWTAKLLLLAIAAVFLAVLPCTIAFADSPEITSAKVFETYEEDFDWLLVVAYNVSEAPYYDNYPMQWYWELQLWDETNTSVASVPISQWGMRPASIYLSADEASSLEWGNENYLAVIVAKYNASINTTYSLTATEWLGDALSMLDAWCLTFANEMEDYDSPTTSYITNTIYGPMLSLDAGVLFSTGISDLPAVRPNIFDVKIEEFAEWSDTEWSNSYSNKLDDWETAVGAELTNAFNDAGDLINIDGRYIGGLCVFIGFIALAALAVTQGHLSAGATLASISLFGGVMIGLIPIAIIFIVIVLLAIMFVKNFWFGGT